jgi:hypothetical protein
MRKLLFYVNIGLLILLSTPIAKAQQDTGPCAEVENRDESCICNGFHNTVFIQGCGGAFDQHCSPSITVICCLNPRITFQTHTQGNDCSGPRTPIALKGLPEGQQVYVRNCNGLYIASLVHHSKAAASGD